MKRTGLIVLAILIFCFPLLSCVKDEEDPAVTAMKAEILVVKNSVATLTTNLATTTKTATDANTNATAALNKANQNTSPDLSPYAKKAEVPKSFYDYVDSLTSDQIATLRAKLGINSSSGSSSGSTGGSTSTGNIGYSVDPVSQFYQFNTGATIKLRIFNNKSDSRYVRPQITLTTYGGTTTGDHPSLIECKVVSNSQGQSAVTFEGTAIPATGAATQIIFTSYSGGISNGQYLLGSGTAMDIYVTIKVTSSTAALWTMTFSGSDSSLTGT